MFARERNPQSVGDRGSLKWIQRLVENQPGLLTDAVRAAAEQDIDWTVDWISPRKGDDWAEYRDAGFLRRLGLPDLIPDLEGFWPRGGPQWDALGKSSDGSVVLVEAKAYLGELSSDCDAGVKSRTQIERSLGIAKAERGASADAAWSTRYYQYANRLAHLTFLRDRGVRTWLVFLYFCGDTEMRGPQSAADWRPGLSSVHRHLGLGDEFQDTGVVNVFIPVETLNAPVV